MKPLVEKAKNYQSKNRPIFNIYVIYTDPFKVLKKVELCIADRQAGRQTDKQTDR